MTTPLYPDSRVVRMPQLLLASGSPRRRQLLADAGYPFTVVEPDEEVERGMANRLEPTDLVQELALAKAENVRAKVLREDYPPETVLVAADTIAECDGHILGKPTSEDHARKMLTRLSGRVHRVFTGLCVWPWQPAEAQPGVQVAVTTLRMDRLSDSQLDEYLRSRQWQGKAGAFGYQDRLGWIRIVEGSETNVVGLPMELLAQMLAAITRDAEESST